MCIQTVIFHEDVTLRAEDSLPRDEGVLQSGRPDRLLGDVFLGQDMLLQLLPGEKAGSAEEAGEVVHLVPDQVIHVLVQAGVHTRTDVNRVGQG